MNNNPVGENSNNNPPPITPNTNKWSFTTKAVITITTVGLIVGAATMASPFIIAASPTLTAAAVTYLSPLLISSGIVNTPLLLNAGAIIMGATITLATAILLGKATYNCCCKPKNNDSNGVPEAPFLDKKKLNANNIKNNNCNLKDTINQITLKKIERDDSDDDIQDKSNNDNLNNDSDDIAEDKKEDNANNSNDHLNNNDDKNIYKKNEANIEVNLNNFIKNKNSNNNDDDIQDKSNNNNNNQKPEISDEERYRGLKDSEINEKLKNHMVSLKKCPGFREFINSKITTLNKVIKERAEIIKKAEATVDELKPIYATPEKAEETIEKLHSINDLLEPLKDLCEDKNQITNLQESIQEGIKKVYLEYLILTVIEDSLNDFKMEDVTISILGNLSQPSNPKKERYLKLTTEQLNNKKAVYEKILRAFADEQDYSDDQDYQNKIHYLNDSISLLKSILESRKEEKSPEENKVKKKQLSLQDLIKQGVTLRKVKDEEKNNQKNEPKFLNTRLADKQKSNNDLLESAEKKEKQKLIDAYQDKTKEELLLMLNDNNAEYRKIWKEAEKHNHTIKIMYVRYDELVKKVGNKNHQVCIDFLEEIDEKKREKIALLNSGKRYTEKADEIGKVLTERYPDWNEDDDDWGDDWNESEVVDQLSTKIEVKEEEVEIDRMQDDISVNDLPKPNNNNNENKKSYQFQPADMSDLFKVLQKHRKFIETSIYENECQQSQFEFQYGEVNTSNQNDDQFLQDIKDLEFDSFDEEANNNNN